MNTKALVMLPLFTLLVAVESLDGDVQVISDRLLVQLLATSDPATAAAAAAAQRPDGGWNDVNYTDRAPQGSWSPHTHLDRMVSMALAARQQGNASLLAAPTALAVDFWLRRDPQSSNWWWNQLRVPARMADCALAFDPFLRANRTRQAGMLAIMRRATWTQRTGANLDDEVVTQVKRAAVLGNASLMHAGFNRLWREVRVSPPVSTNATRAGDGTDGIQADRSFHQHGAQLLSGSYGQAYVADTLTYLALANRTTFAAPPAVVQLFVELLLDGMRWMSIGRNWDWSVKGRDLGTVRYVDFGAISVASLAGLGGAGAIARASELNAYAAVIAGDEEGARTHALVGHRAFWCSDYAVQRSAGGYAGTSKTAGNTRSVPPARWVATLHMHSNRTVSARCVNEQGKISEHTADGMLLLYYTGREYEGAFPLWVWRGWTQLPGITAVQEPVVSCNYSAQLAADSARMPLTGTASDGVAGLSAMRLWSHGMAVRKAAALLPHAIVGLVADLAVGVADAADADADAADVITTIESRPAHGLVTVCAAPGGGCGCVPRILPFGSLEQRVSLRWAHHNGTGYVLFGGAGASAGDGCGNSSALVTNANVTGSWGAIGTSAWGNTTGALFSLALSHGRRARGAPVAVPCAAYVVVPGVSAAQMPGVADAAADVVVVRNDAQAQAVVDGRRRQAMAVIWEAGAAVEFAVLPGSLWATHPLRVTVDHPAVVLVRSLGGNATHAGGLAITASDPANDRGGTTLVVLLSLDGARLRGEACTSAALPAGGNATRVLIALPGGYNAGKSVTVICGTSSTLKTVPG